jgi:hypothetical protein
MSCDSVGNLLLVKFLFQGSKNYGCVYFPSEVVFWLLKHLPVNQDPALVPPPNMPAIQQQDWNDQVTPRVQSVQCTQFNNAIKMAMRIDQKTELVILLDRANVELMRQIMLAYRPSLMDLDA